MCGRRRARACVCVCVCVCACVCVCVAGAWGRRRDSYRSKPFFNKLQRTNTDFKFYRSSLAWRTCGGLHSRQKKKKDSKTKRFLSHIFIFPSIFGGFLFKVFACVKEEGAGQIDALVIVKTISRMLKFSNLNSWAWVPKRKLKKGQCTSISVYLRIWKKNSVTLTFFYNHPIFSPCHTAFQMWRIEVCEHRFLHDGFQKDSK